MTTTVYNGIRYCRRESRTFTRFHWRAAIVWYCVLAIGGFFTLNWIYQVVRKPGEILAPISASFSKSPESSWQSYGHLFEEHSTSVISPEFLAALAQVEGNGNPIARTYWRWQWSWSPFEIYRPASSALGMFQITDATFAEARKYCIRGHTVVADGPWHDLRSCWFNSFYTRTLPSHAIEMTAAYLHRSVVDTLAAGRAAKTKPAQKQQLAAVIHLCGLKRGAAFVARGFRVLPGERCGTHSLRQYLIQVQLMQKRFARLVVGSTGRLEFTGGIPKKHRVDRRHGLFVSSPPYRNSVSSPSLGRDLVRRLARFSCEAPLGWSKTLRLTMFLLSERLARES